LVYILNVTFDDGITGKMVVMDMAGKENPLDFKRFYSSTGKISLGSLLLSSSIDFKTVAGAFNASVEGNPNPDIHGKATIKTTITPDDKKWYQDKIDILREGVFVNETIHQTSCFLQDRMLNKCEFQTMKNAIQTYQTNITKEMSNCADLISDLEKKKGTQNMIKANGLKESVAKMDNKLRDAREYVPEGVFSQYNDKSHRLSPTLMIPVLQYLSELIPGKTTRFVMVCNVRSVTAYIDQTRSTLDFAQEIKST
jgi:hypothetical protein